MLRFQLYNKDYDDRGRTFSIAGSHDDLLALMEEVLCALQTAGAELDLQITVDGVSEGTLHGQIYESHA